MSARSFLDEYAKLRAPSGRRVLELVGSKWGDRPEGDRRELAQILMMILEPLQRPGAQVTDSLRAACEQAVADWVQKTVSVSDLVEGSAERARRSVMEVPRGRRAVKLVNADAIAIDNEECSARVTLDRGGRRHTLTVAARLETSSQLRGGAAATIGVLRQVLGEGSPSIEIRELGTFGALGHTGVIIAVSVVENGKQELLVGVHPSIGTEPVRAAALAVLNAVNRRLGIG